MQNSLGKLFSFMRASSNRNGENNAPSGFSDNDWVLDYRCTKNDCERIASELDARGWKLYRMTLADDTYRATTNKSLTDAVEYFENFKQKPEITMASLCPKKNNSKV